MNESPITNHESPITAPKRGFAMGSLNTLAAVEAARQIAAKKITSEELVQGGLELIAV